MTIILIFNIIFSINKDFLSIIKNRDDEGMNIQELYPTLGISKDVKGITNNSKKVRKDFIFVAIKGKKTNGKKYIQEALNNGACLIVTDQMVLKNYNHIRVKDAKKEYIRLLQLFYHYQHDIYTVGITGTDGKTTTATLLNRIMNLANRSAYIGTNGIEYIGRVVPNKHTTPTPDILYEAYSVFKKHHINDCIMEVSSEGIVDHRVDHLLFDGAIFTNLSHEHFNTHKNMYHYFQAKSELFKSLKPNGLAVINADDPYAKHLYPLTKARIITYGIDDGLYKAENIKLDFHQSEFDVTYKDNFIEHFTLPLFGKYNIYNALATIAYTNELGIDMRYIKKGIEQNKQINGRFMCYTNQNNITGIVDFAHTPNALKCLLENLKEFAKNRIILILGAAGEKDKTKRKSMGSTAIEYADIVIFTSEDPKNESLFGIFKDLTEDLLEDDYYLCLSRKEAIQLAASLAKKDDIIVITGKGNEQSEQILDYHFKHNDFNILKQALNQEE